MKLTKETLAAIIEAIEAEPDTALILPDWAYWKGQDQPTVYPDGLPERLHRFLYRRVVGDLGPDDLLIRKPGVPKRNVNPHLFYVRSRREPLVRTECRNGHPYPAERDMDLPGRWRCRTCYLAWEEERRARLRPTGAQLNAMKTHCKRGHPFEEGNLIALKSGVRRCRTCHRENVAAWRERNRS